MNRAFALVALSLALSPALAACGDSGPQAPTDAGICWHMVQMKDGSFRFNKLAANQPNLENCAARLEAMRERFNQLGAHQEEMIGAYQGQFLFIDPRGVFTAANLSTSRYLALVRTDDGRLAIPGAIRQQQ